MSKILEVSDLERIMLQHIAERGNSDAVNLIWAGFLAGLQIQSYFDPDQYHDLNDQLKDVGREELGELFVGIPHEDDHLIFTSR
jgi:hypothetical protein